MILCRMEAGQAMRFYEVSGTVMPEDFTMGRSGPIARPKRAWRWHNGVAAIDDTPGAARARALQMLYGEPENSRPEEPERYVDRRLRETHRGS